MNGIAQSRQLLRMPFWPAARTIAHLLLLQLLKHAARCVHTRHARRDLQQRQDSAHVLEGGNVLLRLRAVDKHR